MLGVDRWTRGKLPRSVKRVIATQDPDTRGDRARAPASGVGVNQVPTTIKRFVCERTVNGGEATTIGWLRQRCSMTDDLDRDAGTKQFRNLDIRDQQLTRPARPGIKLAKDRTKQIRDLA